MCDESHPDKGGIIPQRCRLDSPLLDLMLKSVIHQIYKEISKASASVVGTYSITHPNISSGLT